MCTSYIWILLFFPDWTTADRRESFSSYCLRSCLTLTTACLNTPLTTRTLSKSAPCLLLWKTIWNGKVLSTSFQGIPLPVWYQKAYWIAIDREINSYVIGCSHRLLLFLPECVFELRSWTAWCAVCFQVPFQWSNSRLGIDSSVFVGRLLHPPIL